MSATKPMRVKTLVVDTDRNGTAQELTENDLAGVRRSRVWGGYVVNLATTGSTSLLTVPAGLSFVLTAATVVQTGAGDVATPAELEVAGTGRFWPERAMFRQEFRAGIALATGAVSMTVHTAQTGTLAGLALVYLEGYFI